jgi:cytochrome c556
MRMLTLALTLLAGTAVFAGDDPSPKHVQWMKDSDTLFDKIRAREDVEANARKLAAIYKEVESFWAPRSAVGGQSSRDLQQSALKLAEVAAGGGDATAIQQATRAIGPNCRSCHDTHREKVAPNVYKIR